MNILSFFNTDKTIDKTNPNHPMYSSGFSKATPAKQASKKRGLPDGVVMVSWGDESRPRKPVELTIGKSFIEWLPVDLDDRVLRGAIDDELDQFDFDQIEAHSLNGEVYELLKVEVLMGMAYGDIAKAHDKSRAWVDQVGRFIKKADEERQHQE